MRFETAEPVRQFGQSAFDDDGNFIASFVESENGEGIDVRVGGTFGDPFLTLDVPGFAVDDVSEWTRHYKKGTLATGADGAGFLMAEIPIAYGYMARFARLLPYDGNRESGPARICADLVETDSGFEMVTHIAYDADDVYDFWTDADGKYRAEKRN